MPIDANGYEVICDDIKSLDYCHPRPLCSICGIECSLSKLLPSGVAWHYASTPKDGLSVCDPIPCDDCEPQFWKRYINYRAKMAGLSMTRAVAAFQELNPITAANPEYWFKKYGLDKTCPVKSRFICDEPECLECRCAPIPFEIPEKALKAIQHGAVKAYLRMTASDFIPSFSGYNEVLSFLGISVSRYSGKPENDCGDADDGYAIGNYEEPENPCEIVYDDVIQDCPPNETADYDKKLILCAESDGFAVDGESCAPCSISQWRLKLKRTAYDIPAAPRSLCASQNECEHDGSLYACFPIGRNDLVNTVFKTTRKCGNKAEIVTYDYGLEIAACLLRKFWPVGQPFEILG